MEGEGARQTSSCPPDITLQTLTTHTNNGEKHKTGRSFDIRTFVAVASIRG